MILGWCFLIIVLSWCGWVCKLLILKEINFINSFFGIFLYIEWNKRVCVICFSKWLYYNNYNVIVVI